jgi:hypothetical protein
LPRLVPELHQHAVDARRGVEIRQRPDGNTAHGVGSGRRCGVSGSAGIDRWRRCGWHRARIARRRLADQQDARHLERGARGRRGAAGRKPARPGEQREIGKQQ